MRRGVLASVPLSWQLSIQGAEQVKSKLDEINSAFNRGEISAEEYAKGVREVNRDARAFVNIGNTQKNLFLATHPTLNALTRATSAFASVSRSLLSISNAINLALIARQGLSSRELEIQSRINDILRQLSRETDPEKIAKLNEELGILRAELKQLGDEKTQANITNIIALIGSVGLAAGSLANVIPKLAPVMKFFSGLSGLTVAGGLVGLLTTIGKFAGAFIVGFVAGKIFFDWLFTQLLNWDYIYYSRIEPILTGFVEFFTQTIPNAITTLSSWFVSIFTQTIPQALGVLMGWFERIFTSIETVVNNAITFIKDSVTSFFNDIVRQIVNFVNYVNSIIFKKGSTTSSSGFAGQQGSSVINSLHAANGFEGMINRPTLMTVAENGSEYVSVTPHGKSSGGTTNYFITFQGSLWTTTQLWKEMDRMTKDSYKRRGFTGV